MAGNSSVAMPDRDSWLKKLEELQGKGIKFNLRVNHGVTRSVYINDPNGYGVELLYEVPKAGPAGLKPRLSFLSCKV